MMLRYIIAEGKTRKSNMPHNGHRLCKQDCVFVPLIVIIKTKKNQATVKVYGITLEIFVTIRTS